MTVISDSSPLITLSKIGRLDLLPQLYGTITITPEVHAEVSSAGIGRPGSCEVAAAAWIRVKPVERAVDLASMQRKFSLGAGEWSAIILSQELSANLVLMDDMKARRTAQEFGLTVLGCIGILEQAFTSNSLPDLQEAYRQLIASGAYVNRTIVENSLKAFNLPLL